MLGRPVPDERGLGERLLRPRPAVWSRRGQGLSGAIVIALLALFRWGPGGVWGVAAVPALFAVSLLVMAADERKRSRAFYDRAESADRGREPRPARSTRGTRDC